MIKIDISMPKGCWSCPYYRSGWNESVCVAKSQKGKKLSRTLNLENARQKWCPIKEVKSDEHTSK